MLHLLMDCLRAKIRVQTFDKLFCSFSLVRDPNDMYSDHLLSETNVFNLE